MRMPCEAPPGSDDGEAVHALPLVHLAGVQNLLLRQEVIHFAVRVMVRRLGAVLTVLRTAPAAAVDDGAQIYFIPHQRRADGVGTPAQLVQVAGQKKGQVVLPPQAAAVDNFLG